MATYLDLIKKLMKPDAIRFVARPSSMEELVTSFRNDPVVLRLLKAGRRAAPVICWELRRNGATMPPLAQACLYWVLCQTAPDMAAHLAMRRIAGPADGSAGLFASLAPEWIPGALLLGRQITGTEPGHSEAPGILASILSSRWRQTGAPVPLQEDWFIPGITTWARH